MSQKLISKMLSGKVVYSDKAVHGSRHQQFPLHRVHGLDVACSPHCAVHAPHRIFLRRVVEMTSPTITKAKIVSNTIDTSGH